MNFALWNQWKCFNKWHQGLIKFKHLTAIHLFILWHPSQREDWPSGGHCTGHVAGDGHGSVWAGAPDGPEPSWPPPPGPWPCVTSRGAWHAEYKEWISRDSHVFEFVYQGILFCSPSGYIHCRLGGVAPQSSQIPGMRRVSCKKSVL